MQSVQCKSSFVLQELPKDRKKKKGGAFVLVERKVLRPLVAWQRHLRDVKSCDSYVAQSITAQPVTIVYNPNRAT